MLFTLKNAPDPQVFASITSGVQRRGVWGDSPRHPRQGGIQRAKLQKLKYCE